MPTRAPIHRPQRLPKHDHRLSAHRRGYTRKWAKYAKWFLAQPENVLCALPGCHQPSTDVDHIVPVSGPDDPLFWEPTNHQALCHPHHSRKTVRTDGGFGAPCRTESGCPSRAASAGPPGGEVDFLPGVAVRTAAAAARENPRN